MAGEGGLIRSMEGARPSVKLIRGKRSNGLMKRMSLMGLCLAAVIATGAIAVTSAFAADSIEVGRCIKGAANSGKYGDAGCSKFNTGEKKYEWSPGAINPGFTSQKKGGEAEPPEATLETVGLGHINCKNESGTGEVTGSAGNVQKVVGKFTGCELNKNKCNSAAKGTGEIDTFNLKGHTGIVKKNATTPAKDKMGTVLEPESGTFLAEFGCVGGLAKIEVKGKVIVEVKPEKMLSKATLKFSAKSGKQKPEKLEGSSEKEVLFSNLSGGEFEQSGQTLTTIQTNKEKLELRVCRKVLPECA